MPDPVGLVAVTTAAALLGLAAAWAAAGLVGLALRRRGSVWHFPRHARIGRAAEARWLAGGSALILAAVGAWVGSMIASGALLGGLVAAGSAAWAAWRVVRAQLVTIRSGELLLAGAEPERDVPPLPPEPPVAAGRRIVILCDGTGNRPPEAGVEVATNIWRMRLALVEDETQTVWYDEGVATGTSRVARAGATLERLAGRLWLGPVAAVLGQAGRLRTAWEALTGTGVAENILEAYCEIARQYRPGDRIYLFGFSRGAYTARAVAGVIRSCGLLKASSLRHAPGLLSLYLARRRKISAVPVDAEFAWKDVPIEVLGVFDTVGSLGAPLWGWWFTVRGFRNQPLNMSPVRNCRHVYHALAMDERRATFFPTLFWNPGGVQEGAGMGLPTWTRTLEQVWFRGAHADIGGGYRDTGLSDITLGWMLERAARHGLSVGPEALATLRPDPMARLHDETAARPSWTWLGTWPRWAKVLDEPPTRGAGISVHPSVFERARRIRVETGRHDLHDLAPGETARFRVVANRQWDRTGLVIRGQGEETWYRLRWVGGRWRDGFGPPCGPAGDLAGELPRAPGAWNRWRRRMPGEPWMALCATIAGPRRWPLREMPLRHALAYLFRRDPRMLLNQLAALGAGLREPGDEVFIRSERPAGLLHLFANDMWRHYAENSGELELELTRLEAPPPSSVRAWVLPHRGRWIRRA